MRTVLILMLALFASGIEVSGQSSEPAQYPVELLRLVEADRTHEIAVHITVDGQSYNDYWTQAIDAIFAFADSNSDGVLNEEEIRFVPSARAIRLSLGTGFTPPVASVQSLKEIGVESANCSKEDLRKYYRDHGVGRPTIGYGKLPNTTAITNAIIRALDEDRDGNLSEAELAKAESTLRRLDANDDELIGVEELVANATYPGNWAANTVLSKDIDLSSSGDRSFILKRLEQTEANAGSQAQKASWLITISSQVQQSPIALATKARCESWSVYGPLSGLNDQLREELANAEAEPPAGAEGARSRGSRPSRAWLTPMVDRDHNGKASQHEIDQWLALQRQLIHGHLLVSVYYGGGLFELLDANHDAGLSVRELRTAWQMLESASCTSESRLDLRRVPGVVFLVVSQGYPISLAKNSTSEVEWFRRMDRNSDGDVSRREFTGSPDAFGKLDQDRDGLISIREATVGQ